MCISDLTKGQVLHDGLRGMLVDEARAILCCWYNFPSVWTSSQNFTMLLKFLTHEVVVEKTSRSW